MKKKMIKVQFQVLSQPPGPSHRPRRKHHDLQLQADASKKINFVQGLQFHEALAQPKAKKAPALPNPVTESLSLPRIASKGKKKKHAKQTTQTSFDTQTINQTFDFKSTLSHWQGTQNMNDTKFRLTNPPEIKRAAPARYDQRNSVEVEASQFQAIGPPISTNYQALWDELSLPMAAERDPISTDFMCSFEDQLPSTVRNTKFDNPPDFQRDSFFI